MKKPLAAATARLQQRILQLHRYDIDIVNKVGKDVPVADALSRKFLSDTYIELSDSMDALVQCHVEHSDQRHAIRWDTYHQIRWTQGLELKRTIMNGLPDNQRDCSPLVKELLRQAMCS